LKFGPLPVAESEGVFLAHAIRRPGSTLKKGEWIGAGQIAALQAAHISEIVAARIEPGEVDENTAALSLALSAAGARLHITAAVTGRCNLIASCAGVLVVDTKVIDRVNMVDEAITLATVAPFCRIAEGEMIATVKIIPYAVSTVSLDRARVAAVEGPLRLAPFRPFRVGVISTLLPDSKTSIVAKALHTLHERLTPSGSKIVIAECTPHAADLLASALRRFERVCDLIVIFGAFAITDRRDVVPSAIEMAGGRIEHFGMPVEPGNLLLLGSLPGEGGAKPVIGAPGCARSPKKNGFDFVLDRILARLPMRSEDIRQMGVGGLLIETASHVQPSAVSLDASVE
jgi:molybdenum cofactor cytidylyltransferase